MGGEERVPENRGAGEVPQDGDILEQVSELRRKQSEALAAIAALSQEPERSEPQRSYVYVPRERQITPFSGDYEKDGRSVDDFIEEVERVAHARYQSANDKYDFVMSLLKGAALEEMRFRSGGKSLPVADLFKYLREAFRDKRCIAQLLHDLYNRKQKDGEDILGYSHALCQILRVVLKQDPNALANEQKVLRDQFIEGLSDPLLKRELRKFAREKPDSTMLQVREEAYLWSVEDASHSKASKSRPKGDSGDRETQCNAMSAHEQNVGTVGDLFKVVAEQGKQISELTAAVKTLTMQRTNSSEQNNTRRRPQLKFTDDGKPICLKCQGEGHIAKNCPQKQNAPQSGRNQGN